MPDILCLRRTHNVLFVAGRRKKFLMKKVYETYLTSRWFLRRPSYSQFRM